MLIEMKVAGLAVDPFSNMPIIILKAVEDKDTALPIWIGMLEAGAIAAELEKVQLPRPMTHDLIKNMLANLDVQVEAVKVVDLKDGTFYARIVLKTADRELEIDARPSDSIALALRANAKILVDEKVIAESRSLDFASIGTENKTNKDKMAELLERMSPEEFGKYKM